VHGKVVAVIGDIVSSRKIKARERFDGKLRSVLEALNVRRTGLLSPYTLTIGDEIQAVFGGAGRLFDDAVAILSAIHPERMRFAIGVGGLSTPINPERAIGMDGQAFYSARAGIEGLKKSGYLFTLMGEGIPALALIQKNLFLISFLMGKWNETRLHTLGCLQQGMPVKDIAARLHISDKAIYKTIEAGNLELIMELFGEIEALIDVSLEEV
jgi:hypothetical protein